MKRVAVVGGGITGLSTALLLIDRSHEIGDGLEVVVLESSDRPGGNIRTEREDGFVMEWGPNGYLDNVPTTPALVRRLGMEDRVQQADDSAAKRYLYRNGRLHLLPLGPIGFLKSPVLSLPGRLRVLLEPFVRAKRDGSDETIYAFVRRRLGHEMASVLIDAMVSGVFAGNIHELSLPASFPKMAAMEADHGGLVRAMIARMKERRAAKREVEERRRQGEEVEELTRPGGPAGPGGTLTSFRDGLDTWAGALQRELADAIRPGSRVTSIDRPDPSRPHPWTVVLEKGEGIEVDAVVLTIPSPLAAPLLSDLDAELGQTVSEIPTAGLAVVALGYRESDLGQPPDGFGFLVPRGEGIRMLGCLWDSSVFPGRAEPGKILLRAMIGGAHDPEAVELDDDTLIGIVRGELATVMRLDAEPIAIRIFRHPLGIGQYTLGHGERMDVIHSRLDDLPGLWLAGSSYYGISMNNCIQKAGEQAAEIVRFLGRS